MARLLFGGYFGCGNLGDDAVMLGIAYGLEGSKHEIEVLSGAPEETYRAYGLPAVPRMDQAAVKAAIDKCDALVFPGGSVFQDVTSVRSVYYYSQLVQQAKKAKKRVVLVGQGVGPLTRWLGKRFAASAFNAANVVVVRDPASATELTKLGVKKKVRIAADSAFLLPQPNLSDSDVSFKVGDMRAVGLAPRPYGKSSQYVVHLFAGIARALYEANILPVLIEMDRTEDAPLIEAINRQHGGKIPDLRKIQTPMQMQQRMARLDGVIAMRLHAGVLAASVGVPPYMVAYDPKVSAFSKLLELNSAPPLKGLNAARLVEGFQQFLKDRERNQKILERKRGELLKLAEINVQAILDAV